MGVAKKPKDNGGQERKAERAAIREALAIVLDGRDRPRSGYAKDAEILETNGLLVRAVLNAAETVEAVVSGAAKK